MAREGRGRSVWLALVGWRLCDWDASPRRSFLCPDRQRDRQDAVGQRGLGTAGADRSGQLDLAMRRPDRPFVLDVVVLRLRIARLGVDDQPATHEAHVDRVVVRARYWDRDRELVVCFVDVYGRRID